MTVSCRVFSPKHRRLGGTPPVPGTTQKVKKVKNSFGTLRQFFSICDIFAQKCHFWAAKIFSPALHTAPKIWPNLRKRCPLTGAGKISGSLFLPPLSSQEVVRVGGTEPPVRIRIYWVSVSITFWENLGKWYGSHFMHRQAFCGQLSHKSFFLLVYTLRQMPETYFQRWPNGKLMCLYMLNGECNMQCQKCTGLVTLYIKRIIY